MLPFDRVLPRLFGVALVAHIVGNWHQPDLPSLDGWIALLVGLLGITLLLVPTRLVFLLSAAATGLSVVTEIPQTGNHWLLTGLASLIILITGGRGPMLTVGLRWLLVVFYGFAAFAKLNAGFFDPNTSCALFYANQSLGSWGLLTVPPSSVLARVAIWGTALIELSVVPLLIWRRTRWLGIVVGSLFHGLISLDLDQHFYDFTAVLYFLFAAFLPSGRPEGTDRGRIGLLTKWIAAPATFFLVVLSVLSPTEATTRILSIAPFLLWIPFLVGWIGYTVRKREPSALDWRLAPAAGAVVALAFLNGLTPYTELKTAYSFNMYSNLLTAQGVTNHMLIPQTFRLRDGYRGPVQIVESSDPGLSIYRKRGYLIAYPQFQQYLVGRSISVTFVRDGITTKVDDTHAVPGLASTGPWWWHFMPLRALDEQSPPRCQDVFLPAL